MIEFVTIQEHASDKYPPRTYYNAKLADLTVAIAADYSTPGEKLTHKAAGERYFRLDLNTHKIDASLMLKKKLDCGQILNIAGNSLPALVKNGYSQEYVNRYLFDILSFNHFSIHRVVSGGQTGVDFAAGVACEVLGIPCTMTFPKGYLQRFTNKDIIQTKEQVLERLQLQVDQLRKDIELENYN